MKKVIYTLFVISLMFPLGVSAQKNEKKQLPVYQGVVMDEFNKPLSGVIIKVVGEENGTISNPDGSFELFAPAGTGSLDFEFIGYRTQQCKVDGSDKIIVRMEPDVTKSNQVINIPYEERERLGLTQAIATVTGDELSKTHFHTLGAALAGRLPGLIVETSENMPGSEEYSLKIRGTSTTRENKSPLILIDGMVVDGFNHINPADVESVNIYKDAASTALYGMQGGNGVISIITKRGKLESPKVAVDINYTMQKAIETPHIIGSWQYASLMNEALNNDGLGDYAKFSQEEIDSYRNGTNLNLYPNNNWYDMYMKPMVQTENVNISANGGKKFFKYYTSLGYMHQDYPYETDGTSSKTFGIHRFHVRSNVDFRINDFITGYMNVAARVQSNMKTNGDHDGIYSSLFELPSTIYGPLSPDGKVVVTPEVTSPTFGRLNRSGYLRILDAYVTSNIGLKIDLDFITKGLALTGGLNFYTKTLSNITGTMDYERWTRDTSIKDELVFTRFGTSRDEPITLSKSVQYRYMSEFAINVNYDRLFGLHGISANLFGRYQYDNPPELTQIQPLKRLTAGAKMSYSYDNMFFADAVVGVQGTDQFLKGHRFGMFPALSASWVLSNMDFMDDSKDVLSLLKLRASYGISGTDNIENYLYRETLNTAGNGFIASMEGMIDESRLPNPLVTWEKVKQTNVGLDLGLFNQISLSLDYFNVKHDDILVLGNTLPSVSGIPGTVFPYLNQGVVKNQGVDFAINWQKQLSQDWFLSVGGNFAYANNEIHNVNEVRLGDDYYRPYRQIGYSVGELWGYKVDYSNGNGFFNSAEEIAQSGLTYEGTAPRPGDLIFQDLNNDKIIDKKDLAPMGMTEIPALSWGANINLKWKSLDISMLFQGLSNYGVFESGLGFYETTNQGTFFDRHLNAWTEERYKAEAEITHPALSLQATSSQVASDYYLRDKSFARLKNVEIGYTLPYSWSRKLTAQKIRAYVSGYNLLTIDKASGIEMDIEQNSLGAYPTNRYFTIGLNVMF